LAFQHVIVFGRGLAFDYPFSNLIIVICVIGIIDHTGHKPNQP